MTKNWLDALTEEEKSAYGAFEENALDDRAEELDTETLVVVSMMCERLANEVVRLRDKVARLNAGDYMEGFEEGVASCQERMRELEAKLKAWEEAPVVEIVPNGKGRSFKFWTDIPNGTYHLKPKEAHG